MWHFFFSSRREFENRNEDKCAGSVGNSDENDIAAGLRE